jgi:hypothetical protein
MKPEEKVLWIKITEFNIDDNTAGFKFSQRLARENGWNITFAKQVIEEYKKFIFLCCISQNGVTPSDQVDQAWHLHLTYTKSYWIDLCRNTLEKEIHHNPTKGGNSENLKFNDFYSDTLKLYKEKFGTLPPESIWPTNEIRFSDIDFQKVNFKRYWLIRRPNFNKRMITIILMVFSSLFIQAEGSNEYAGAIVIIILAIMVYVYHRFFSDGSGCSSSGGGCSTGNGCSAHSGCSGCSSSGCSGCGSGCGGGD